MIQSLKPYILAVAGTCFTAGVGLGYFLFTDFNRGYAAAEERGGSELHEEQSVEVSALNNGSSRSNLDDSNLLNPDSRDAVSSVADFSNADLQGISGLRKSSQYGPLVVVPKELIATMSYAGQIKSLDQNLFSEDSELANQLQITDSERGQLETAWNNMRETVRQMEAQSAQIEEKPDGSLEILLPDLSSQIAAVGDGFNSLANETLGANRAEVLTAATQVDRVLGNLGSARKLTVQAEPTGDGDWRFHTVVDSSEGKRVYVGENIPTELQHVAGELKIAAFE